MKIMNLTERKEDAVSPVIGVMLMLVVTIVIAAVVAAFAGGLATETEATPITVLDVDVHTGKVVLRSLSGDNLQKDETALKVQSLDGTKTYKSVSQIDTSGYFKPGEKITLEGMDSAPKVGEYVEVSVIVDGKHIVLSKEVLVKA